MQSDEQHQVIWVEQLLRCLLLLALVNGVATLHSVTAGLLAGAVGLIVVAAFSLSVNGANSRSSRDWREYLESGQPLRRSVAMPRLSMVAFVQLALLAGILYAVFFYIGEHYPAQKWQWMACVGYYGWVAIGSALAALSMSGTKRWANSPALCAGAGAACATALYLVGFYIVDTRLHPRHFAQDGTIKLLIYCLFLSLLTGVTLGMPIGVLMSYWSNPRKQRSGKTAPGNRGLSPLAHLYCGLPIALVFVSTQTILGGFVGGASRDLP